MASPHRAPLDALLLVAVILLLQHGPSTAASAASATARRAAAAAAVPAAASAPPPPASPPVPGLGPALNPHFCPLAPTWNATHGTTHPGPSSPNYVAMCVIVRDEMDDVLEWVEHHLSLGAGRVYMFDHASEVPVLPAFAPLVEAGLVRYHWLTSEMMQPHHADAIRWRTGDFSAQGWVYHECLQRYGHKHRWMAFFDVDEFLLLRDRRVRSLRNFLAEYEAYGGLAVSWMVMGSSGHLTRPTNVSTLAAYTNCHRDPYRKLIVNTEHAWGINGDPHSFCYRDDHYAVNEAFQRADLSKTPDNWRGDKVVLHHYVLKSLEQFKLKVERGGPHGSHGQRFNGRRASYFNHTNRLATNSCADATQLMAGRTYLGPRLAMPGLVAAEQRVDGNGVMGWRNVRVMRNGSLAGVVGQRTER